MERQDAKTLQAGSAEHYSAYVGPPDQYDFMGATQFRLACALGLREDQYLLDFGCGSLRAGRLFIPYLLADRYCGVEPNAWLVKDAIAGEFGGDDIVRLKRPRFDYNDEFRVGMFGTLFDFIVAQSIFSHCGSDLIARALQNFRDVLRCDGVVMATFVPNTKQDEYAGSGWVYPGCVAYGDATIRRLADSAQLACTRIPWFHPRQDWYLFAHDVARLPSAEDAAQHLSGKVLWDKRLQEREV
jgi:cyclopropane fatty-acyl-phospholipid synthase-like methyltransferase